MVLDATTRSCSAVMQEMEDQRGAVRQFLLNNFSLDWHSIHCRGRKVHLEAGEQAIQIGLEQYMKLHGFGRVPHGTLTERVHEVLQEREQMGADRIPDGHLFSHA